MKRSMAKGNDLMNTLPTALVKETEVAKALREELQADFVDESRMFGDRPIFLVRKDAIIQAVKVLVDDFDARLLTVTAVDNGVDFELIYHLAIKSLVVNLKTLVAKEDSHVSSITGIVPGAISAEREIWDLFQIKFEGISDPRAYIAPYEWRDTKSPLRKPLAGIVGSYQKPTVEKLMQTGQVLPITSSIIKEREKLKLPSIRSTPTQPDAVKEIRTIAHEVKFDKKTGYDLDKNKLRY